MLQATVAFSDLGQDLSVLVRQQVGAGRASWIAENTYATATGSLDGWHTLVLQVASSSVSYYLDGVLLASHGGMAG